MAGHILLYYQSGIENTSFVAGVCLFADFFVQLDSATYSSGGAWFARANSEHTTFYNRTVLFDLQRPKWCSILCHEANTSDAITV